MKVLFLQKHPKKEEMSGKNFVYPGTINSGELFYSLRKNVYHCTVQMA